MIRACQGWFHLPTIFDLVLGGAVLVANSVTDPAVLKPLRDTAHNSTPGLALWFHHAPDSAPLHDWLKSEKQLLTRIGYDCDKLDRAIRAPRPLVKFYDWRRALRGEDPIPAAETHDRDALSELDPDAIEEDMLDAGGIEDSGEEDAEIDSATPPPAESQSEDDRSSKGRKTHSDTTPASAAAAPAMPAEYNKLPDAVRAVESVKKAARELSNASSRDRKQKLEAFNCAVWAVPREDDITVTGEERVSPPLSTVCTLLTLRSAAHAAPSRKPRPSVASGRTRAPPPASRAAVPALAARRAATPRAASSTASPRAPSQRAPRSPAALSRPP